MIPARIGSKRLKVKNLAILNNQPLIYYAVEAAKKSAVFNKIVINSDHIIFKKIADRLNVDFYLRPKNLGSSATKSDDVIANFIKNYPKAEIVAWVNSIAPLQQPNEIKSILRHFIKNKLDSLITVEDKNVHSIFNDKPINFNFKESFARTQDLNPVKLFVYSLMVWNSNKFIEEYNKTGGAIFCGKFKTFSISKLNSLIIKTKEDLLLAEAIIKNRNFSKKTNNIKYDRVFNLINKQNDKK